MIRWAAALIVFSPVFLSLAEAPRPNPPGRAAQALPPVLPGIEARTDIPYAATNNKRQRLDLYLPKDRAAGKKLPVLVFVHGGAWLGGDKSQARGPLLPHVREGLCAGISIGYRLSSEAIWPAQIHDCKAAIRWIKANAEAYGLDPDRIVVQGSSAGGHLVAVLGASAGVPEMDGDLGPHVKENTRVAGVIDLFGPTDVSQMDAQRLPGGQKHDGAGSPESKLLGAPVQSVPDKVKSANPITYVDPKDPPFLIIHGDKDPLVPHGQSVLLVDSLKKAAVPCGFYTVPGGGHGGFKDPEVPQRIKAFLAARFSGQLP
jgi:acetyl esterase/lipase